MHKITPCLWFDDQLEEAIAFYADIFDDARLIEMQRDDQGRAFTAIFELAGQRLMGLNGGPYFHFTEAISFFVDCKDQSEVDHYWARLLEGGGAPSQCGWLKDRYGLSWQIAPEALIRYLRDPDRERAERVRQAMLKMVKIDVAALDRAWAG